MYPSGSFPREQQASIGPQQLPFGHHRIKHAAASCRRAPYFMTGAGSYVRDGMDHASAAILGPNAKRSCDAGMRMNAIWRESGDQTGSASWSTAGSTYRRL